LRQIDFLACCARGRRRGGAQVAEFVEYRPVYAMDATSSYARTHTAVVERRKWVRGNC